jgi:hypothetical protein
MKRIIFTLLIAFASSIAFTACTEDEVAPQNAEPNVGSVPSDSVHK